ncbi:hypothetical protein ACFFQW_05750 [Umezawaea endophytica]|uniref:Uncharacterized protein n=1 Tax=Umezawaea endophytica TaxID=1654476 RepID=A0A9X3A7V7_9PSEU|nr:hypothetical protein [Umezawaea endophytica]MCS7484783.1 hypothetical protein [Umezawaea endophytica]
MLPRRGAAGSLIGISDAFDVPVFVRRSTPLTPDVRPKPALVSGVVTPWPRAGEVPPSGAYRVGTTWRDVIDAAISVGRDRTAWLTATPSLAWAEILARRSPLSAYLVRTRHRSSTGGTGFTLAPNVVYTDGTEATAKAAFGYRAGVTMAEWACRGLMGLGATVHAEAHAPTGAGREWSATGGLPDLVGYHPSTGLPWLVEAKASNRLGKQVLAKGAQQLRRPGLMDGPHVKVLCGTSLADRVFVTLDVEEGTGTPPSASEDARLLTLALSRMPLYLALVAMPRRSWSVLPVGAGVTERGTRRGGIGLVTLLEEDRSTMDERETARREDGRRDRRLDMLTGQVPGTDLVVGLSRRLFGACAALARVEVAVAAEVDHELPRPRSGDGDGEAERNGRDRWLIQRQVERGHWSDAVGRTRDGFDEGAGRSWEDLLQSPVTFSPDPRPGFLEAATEDTYLAVDATAVSAVQR